MPKIKVKNPNYKEGGEKWLDVTFYNNTSGGELEEAPNDGRDYVRRDSDWVVSRKIYDELGISKTRFESLLNSSYYIPTLRNVPNENTLIYVDGEYNVNFKVGDYCRVANPDNKYGYDFFRLYDIKDGLAVWSADEVEGDTVINGETVLISLASNQSFTDSALIGATILVYDVNDDINLLETTWQGTEILLVVPENHMYTVMVGDVQGYKNPGIKTMEAVNGATRVLNMLYETMVLSIKFSSNDAANTSTATATVTYDSMTVTVLSGQAIKIPYGARVNVECSKILYFKTPIILEFTANQPIKEISSEYITSYLVVNYTKNQSIGGTPTITVVTEGITRPYVANMICAPEEQVTINFGELEYYKTPAPITFTKGVNIETKQGDYLSENVIVTLNTSDSKAVTNQVITLTCSTDSSYSKTYTCTSTSTSGDSGFLFYIPYGYAYKLKANNFYSYAPISDKNYTANSTTRTVTLLYTPGNITIYYNSGGLPYSSKYSRHIFKIGNTSIDYNDYGTVSVPYGTRMQILLVTYDDNSYNIAWYYTKGNISSEDSKYLICNNRSWSDIDTEVWEDISIKTYLYEIDDGVYKYTYNTLAIPYGVTGGVYDHYVLLTTDGHVCDFLTDSYVQQIINANLSMPDQSSFDYLNGDWHNEEDGITEYYRLHFHSSCIKYHGPTNGTDLTALFLRLVAQYDISLITHVLLPKSHEYHSYSDGSGNHYLYVNVNYPAESLTNIDGSRLYYLKSSGVYTPAAAFRSSYDRSTGTYKMLSYTKYDTSEYGYYYVLA